MTAELSGELNKALVDLGALAIVVFDSHDQELLRAGPIQSDPASHLCESLFGGSAEVARLRQSLEGQLLPQIWSQGEVHCFVTKLPCGTLYGVFLNQELDPVALYESSQRVARRFDSLLQGSSAA